MNAEAFEQKKHLPFICPASMTLPYPSPGISTSISHDPSPSLDYILFEHSLNKLGNTTKNCFSKVLPSIASMPQTRKLLQTWLVNWNGFTREQGWLGKRIDFSYTRFYYKQHLQAMPGWNWQKIIQNLSNTPKQHTLENYSLPHLRYHPKINGGILKNKKSSTSVQTRSW